MQALRSTDTKEAASHEILRELKDVEYRRADAKRIKFNLDNNLMNDCKRMLDKIGRKIYY